MAFRAVTPHRLILMAGVVFLATVALHLPFAIFDSFGEQDAARIAIAAQYGHLNGHLLLANQWPFSTPAYIHLLYLALHVGIISGDGIIFTMAVFSLLFSSLFSTAFFVFMAKATRSAASAAVMTVLVQAAPFFWLSSLYGFPTIVALGLFMTGALVFQASIPANSRVRVAGIVAAALLYISSVLCKVDMVIASALFCLPVWQTPKSLKVKAGWTLGLFASSLFAFWLLNRYGVMLSKYDRATANWEAWSAGFYRGLSSIISRKNIEVIGRAAGVASFPLALAGAILAGLRKPDRTIVVWTLLTFVPVTLFWSMISGNSARHNLIPAVFVTVLMALPLGFLKRWARAGWGICIIAVCVVNYFWGPPSASTVMPSGRLIESAALIKGKCRKRSAKAREITRMPEDKILIVAPKHLLPIYYFEPMVAPHLRFLKKGGGKILVRERATGKTKELFYPDRKKRKRALKIAKKQGYAVVRVK